MPNDQSTSASLSPAVLEPPRAFRRYLILLIATVFSLVAVHMVACVVIDPYKVFGVFDLNKRNFELSTRFAKIEHLKTRDFKGFILGASETNGYPVSVATDLTGTPFYSMNAGGDTPSKMYKKLAWLIDNTDAKHVILNLFYGHQPPVDPDNLTLYAREHPEVEGESKLAFLWRYLWVKPRILAIAIYGNFIKSDTWWTFDEETGHYHFTQIEQRLVDDHRCLIADRYAAVPRFYPDRTRINPEQLAYVRRMVDLARDHDVELTVVNNPYYHRYFRSFDMTVYAEWLTAIVETAGEVWDFAGLNSVVTDERMFFDTSHFTFQAGELALRRIFDPTSPLLRKHPDFGVRVTKATLADRIEAIQRQLEIDRQVHGNGPPASTQWRCQ